MHRYILAIAFICDTHVLRFCRITRIWCIQMHRIWSCFPIWHDLYVGSYNSYRFSKSFVNYLLIQVPSNVVLVVEKNIFSITIRKQYAPGNPFAFCKVQRDILPIWCWNWSMRGYWWSSSRIGKEAGEEFFCKDCVCCIRRMECIPENVLGPVAAQLWVR